MRAGSAPICRPAFPKSSEICNTCVSGSVSPPQVTIMPSGSNVILTWPTNATGFTLQSTTNLVSSVFWTPVSPAQAVVNEQNSLINPISVAQQFYRLAQ